MRLSHCSFVFLAALWLGAQENTIRTTVPIVVLPVTVTDAKGQFVYGLQASDFVLLDAGKERPVRVDSPDSGLAPPRLAILIQSSDTSDAVLQKIRKTGAMVQQAVIGAGGEAAVLSFSDTVTVVQDFTGDGDKLSDAFRFLQTAESGDGRMLDATSQALEMLANQPNAASSSILIIGENRDRGSKIKLNELLPRLARSPVTVDSLVYSAYLSAFTVKGGDYQPPDSGGLLRAITETGRLGKKNTAAALTSATGGVILRFETQSKLENDFIRLGTQLHSRYLVSFTPEQQQTARFHPIQVKIKGQPQLAVRTRPGYWPDLRGQ